MILSATVNAAPVALLNQNLNDGPAKVEFITVDNSAFEDGYIYRMAYTAPENGWYNVTADGTLGLVLGYSDYDDTEYDGNFDTYENDTVTFRDPVLAYKDDPYRSGAVCAPVYLDKGEAWSFSVIGKYFGSSYSTEATFKANLIRKRPNITGVSVNKSVVGPGDTVTYSIGFDQNMETWGKISVVLSENIYGPDGQDIFTMSSYHAPGKYEYKVEGNSITFSYPVTSEYCNEVRKVDRIDLSFEDYSSFTYANDTFRSWNSVIPDDAGYIPGVSPVKFVTGKCYHTILSGWLYTAEQDGKEYELCELCDHKRLLGTVPCTHSWNSGKVTRAATYDAAGVKTYTCTKCGETKTSAIAKLIPQKGDVITIGKVKYKVTGSSAVSYIRTASTTKTIKIPSFVKIGGKKYSVTAIAANAFKGKNKITSVTIPKTVATIGAQAFYGCTSLKKITIPASVKTIGKKAFYNCKKLKSVIIKTTKLTNKTVGAGAFAKINSAAIVKVPKSKLGTYKKLLRKKGIKGKKQKITK